MIAGQLGGSVVFGLSVPERDLIGHAGFRDQSQGFQAEALSAIAELRSDFRTLCRDLFGVVEAF